MANPPVARIMDYGKFKFDAAQRAKESRRKAVHVGIKEMKYRPKIGPGDFDTKTRQVAKFLEEGHKVKITIMFRGREVFHPELGKKILDRIADQMDGIGKPESVPRLDGRNMVMVLAPDKRAKQSAASRGPRSATERPATNSDTPSDEQRHAGDEQHGAEPGDDGASTAGTSTGPAAPAPAAPAAPAAAAAAPASTRRPTGSQPVQESSGPAPAPTETPTEEAR